jgi:hypothetical protein
MDITSIEIGEDFSTVIERAVAASQVMLVLIGQQWMTLTDSHGNRLLDNPSDWIRVELEAAFEHNVVVVPVLIDDARMPRLEHLPAPLRGLAMLQPAHLHRDRFPSDVEALLHALEDIVDSASARTPGVPTQHVPIAPPPARGLMFVSYSHADVYWLGRLQIHLKPLARQGRIEIWDDTQIQVGDEWRREIRKALEACSVAILLISADFLASDFIDNNELPPLLDAARARGVRILPILVSSSSFEDSDLGRFQAVNVPSKPLDMVSKGEQEAVFTKLHKAVRATLVS